MKANDADDARTRIITAAAALIRTHGTDAATTRAVSAAASIQPPTIYRLVGDKDALLDAVAEFELAAYVATKKDEDLPSDPIEALRFGWDKHVAFGLSNPALFRIISNNAASPAAKSGIKALAKKVHAVALAGRLQGSEERAVAMMHATCTGVVISLIAQEQTPAHFDLAAETREAVIQAITNNRLELADEKIGTAATTLRARLGQSQTLTNGERGLMDELLLRLGSEI
ncbi:TetR/AcrR family transcriptional regulator [Serratia sp. M24T3]|uniref:TetR/AcrR family transcriptional regulator n=1 Tax=Serratia sp. M24T3 TaxID=932213 RepID=UPI00025B9862|nr:TetR/AcrR family transcriptional regulator [Serratia sp. M24T3]EIC85934.1 TetR family transcriptional regulator [Serratia sp. M24T3]